MAIKDFTSALASRAYRDWFQKLDPNIIKQSSSSLREKYESNATINNFLITDQKIKDMAAFVTDGRTVTDQEVSEIKSRMLQTLSNAKNAGVAYNVKDFGMRDPKLGQELVIENVNFQTIESILESGFGKKLTGSKRSVGSGFHRGHVYGLPTVLLNETISKLETADLPDDQFDNVIGRGKTLKNMLVNILKAYQTELRNQDLASSNMGTSGINYDIYAEYSKNPEQFLIEMQVNVVNTGSGRQAGKTITELKQFLNPEKINSGLINKVLASVQKPSVILNFLTSPGSPPWITLVSNKIANAIDPYNKSRAAGTYKIPSVKVATSKINITRSAKDKNLHKKEIQKVTKIIAELQSLKSKEASIRSQAKTTNLTSLQNLINQSLVERVKQNMGTGNRRDVLNLQTGRFAESVKVERMTESREGMITAFYSYMKNPYATFSQGGRQQNPKSRDPKLLIARSIREIATAQVANRLRSVSL